MLLINKILNPESVGGISTWAHVTQYRRGLDWNGMLSTSLSPTQARQAFHLWHTGHIGLFIKSSLEATPRPSEHYTAYTIPLAVRGGTRISEELMSIDVMLYPL